jgi:hypothetical protein
LESSGEITPPCGVPVIVDRHWPSAITPAASQCRSSFSTRRSEIRSATSFSSFLWSMLPK